MPKRTKISNDVYARRLAAMRPYIKTSIRSRKHFSSGQKAAISKQWARIGRQIGNVARGQASFVKATTRQQRNLGQKPVTAKGFFVRGAVARASVRGRGKATTLNISYTRGRRDTVHQIRPQTIEELVRGARELRRKNPGAYVALRVYGHTSAVAFDEDALDEYFDGAGSTPPLAGITGLVVVHFPSE